MTHSGIIEELYRSKELDDCIRKLVQSDHQDDFKQELFLIIYALPQDRVIKLHAAAQLRYYIVRIIINLHRHKRNVYHKQYKDHRIVYNSDQVCGIEITDEVIDNREELEQRELDQVQRLYDMDEMVGKPYFRILAELIAKHGSQRAVSRLTGIPKSAINDAVKKIRNHLSPC